MSNPLRLELFRRTCVKKHLGIGVNEAVDDSDLGQSAVSQYFKQMLELGILRRTRAGRGVAYEVECSAASAAVAEIVGILYRQYSNGSKSVDFVDDFNVFGNAFRLRAIKYIAQHGPVSKESLAEKFDREVRLITRDLEPAVKGGILSVDSDDADGLYTYIPPRSAVSRKVVELS